MSDRGRPDAALKELELLVRSLGEELAFFRRRALEAERRLREFAPEPGGHPSPGAPAAASELRTRVGELERENQDLRARLDEAAAKTRQMAERVRFLRQQQEAAGER